MQQCAARVDGIRERDEVLVELAGGDRVKKQAFGSIRGPVAELGPEGSLRLFAGSGHGFE